MSEHGRQVAHRSGTSEEVIPARAVEYHAYLLEGVQKMRAIAGYVGVEVMRRDERAGAAA